MVNWDIVKRLVSDGGLQITDLGLSNLAMGGKLLWQLFSNKKHSVSQIFWKKYLKGGTLRNLQVINIPKGTITWNLCRRGLDLFAQYLYRIPENGRKTFLCDDKIKGNAPLYSIQHLQRSRLGWLIKASFGSLISLLGTTTEIGQRGHS